MEGDAGKPQYRVDEFVQDAVSLRITPFMLDAYSHEYEDLVVRCLGGCQDIHSELDLSARQTNMLWRSMSFETAIEFCRHR